MLHSARARCTQQKIAEFLEIDVRTVRRWEARESEPPTYLSDAIKQRVFPLVNDVANDSTGFRFIDLFAGIDGICLGFDGKTDFSWDNLKLPSKGSVTLSSS
ncbi:MAG: hypothetical protein WC965_13770 [Thiohalomonadaceae bacterium]